MPILVLQKIGPEDVTSVFEVGEHVVGRGTRLLCTSKKVSRKHGILRVTENEGMFLRSIHNNPCFYQSHQTQHIDIISFDKTVKLNDNDKIALSLDHGWFKVQIKSTAELPDINVSEENMMANTLEETSVEIGARKRQNEEEDETTIMNETPVKRSRPDDDTQELNNVTSEAVEETSAVIKSEPPDEIEATLPAADSTAASTSTSTPPSTSTSTTSVVIKQEPADSTCELTNSEAVDTTEVKQEPVDSVVQVKQEETAGQSEMIQNAKQEDNAGNSSGLNVSVPSTSGTNGRPVRRERCWYGNLCYRKNQIHRATFSHPNDHDYDSDPGDPRPICCYGIHCYRRNRDHRQKYRHPGQENLPDHPYKNKSKNGNHSAEFGGYFTLADLFFDYFYDIDEDLDLMDDFEWINSNTSDDDSDYCSD